MYLTRLLRRNRNMTAPANRMNGAIAEMLNAVICAVTVVPMLAPMMTPMAWDRFIIPELTKPMTMISVADELWTRIVTANPTNTAMNLLDVAFSRMVCRLSPQAFRRPEDMTVIP